MICSYAIPPLAIDVGLDSVADFQDALNLSNVKHESSCYLMKDMKAQGTMLSACTLFPLIRFQQK